jgi:hypothetical protein
MKVFKDMTGLKKRLMFSLIFGLLGVLAYAAILMINDFEINESNLFILFMLPGIFFKIFVCCTGLLFFLLTIYVILKKGFSNILLIQTIISLTVVLLISVPEYQKIKRSQLFDATNADNLSSSKINSLYLKASEKNDIIAISNLAGQKNISDSLELKLSDSKHMEIRRKIGWNSDSKLILIKLSKDKDYEVRMAVATNKLTPIEIVDSLQSDSNEMVKNTAFSMYQARKMK